MKKHKIGLAYGVCLAAFTVFITLDTFVLTNAYRENATEMNTSMFDAVRAKTSDSSNPDSGAANRAEPQERQNNAADGSQRHGPPHKKTEGRDTQSGTAAASSASEQNTAAGAEARSYEDENIRIALTEQNVNGTAVYVADVRLSSAEYLKTAFANDTYGKNVTAKTSVTAAAHNAILAVNGDYYGAQERGYVIRNGIVYRDSAGSSDVLCIYADGSLEIVDPKTVTAQELADRGVWQAFSFGPALVENGSVSVSQNTEVGKAMASNPRTAIGMIDALHYVFVVSDGRTGKSEGLSLYELARFMQRLGVRTAYNLDGGGSSTMVFQGELINNPTTTGNSIKERGVSDIVYVG